MRDVSLGLPQALEAHDDQATTAEDTAIVIDVLGNDVLGSTSVVPVIVTGPTHGALIANADGTFSYTPNANYFGSDSFSYKLTDGALESNVATVTLTITPAYTAPVASDALVIGTEDTPLPLRADGLPLHGGPWQHPGQHRHQGHHP